MMKKRLLVSIINVSALLIMLFIQFPASAEEEGGGKKLKEEIGKDIILREEYESVADEEVKKGNGAFQKSEFKLAIDHYLNAVSNLRKCSQSSEVINQKIEACDKSISKAYMYWSEKVVAEAEKLSQAKMYDQAIKQCKKAIEIYPPCRKRMEEFIESYKTMKGIVSYRKEKSAETVIPDKEDMAYKIDVLQKKGVAYYKDGQLDKARDQFEEILVINPYNMKAIDNLRKVNREIMNRGKARTNATRMERIAEVEWKMVTPVVPRTITGAVESVVQPIEKKTVTDKIQEKLKNIIIDHIEFEEVTIPTVVKYLKQRSKQIDPEKVGVNIFLRLSKEKPPSEESAAGEPGGGGGEDAWGETDGGDEDAWGEDDGGGDNAAGAGTEGGTEGGTGGAGMDSMDVPTVTMVVDDIPLGEAIRYICRAANLKHRVEKYAVVIASPNVPLDDVETKIYPLDNEAIDSIGDDSEALKKHFESRGILFPAGAKIVYDSRISRLIATNTPENLKKIEEIIHNEFASIDPQVLIQTKFVEIEQNDLDELGFQYTVGRSPTWGNSATWQPWEAENAGPGSQTWDFNDNTVRNVQTNGIGDIAAGARPDEILKFYHYNDKNVAFSAMVHALDQCDTADVLSTPRVTTMNGEEATIRMVTDFYYPESWGEATVATTTDQNGNAVQVFVPSIPEFGDPTEEGIILRVTPNVDADRYTITLDMNPVIQERVGWTDYSYGVQITDAQGNVNNFVNTIRMAIIEARTVQTSVTIYDGETIILGGIIKDTTNTIDDQYPILGDVPIVGRMFQSKAKSSSKTNLLIFLTCRLVNPDGSPIRERELRGLPAFRQ